MARVGKCQTIIVDEKRYSCGEVVPYIRWKLDDETENEIYDAHIVAIDGIRVNRAEFRGEDHNGKIIEVCIPMSAIID